jgi:hypothetical protein
MTPSSESGEMAQYGMDAANTYSHDSSYMPTSGGYNQQQQQQYGGGQGGEETAATGKHAEQSAAGQCWFIHNFHSACIYTIVQSCEH